MGIIAIKSTYLNFQLLTCFPVFLPLRADTFFNERKRERERGTVRI
jgi:hypothetical protein